MKEVKLSKAMFAAGCFWGVQYQFQKIPGVVKTFVGYSGGKKEFVNPSYEQVCENLTNHAETVLVEFNPKIVSYEELVEKFWKMHDPTTENMQWPDVGSQYRSAIFYFSEKQKKEAFSSKRKMQNTIRKKVDKKIVTQIVKASKFYPAEEYHQDYVKQHGVNSCHIGKNPYL